MGKLITKKQCKTFLIFYKEEEYKALLCRFVVEKASFGLNFQKNAIYCVFYILFLNFK